MGARVAKAALTKVLRVQRSNRRPSIYWWSLPVSLRQYLGISAGAWRDARTLADVTLPDGPPDPDRFPRVRGHVHRIEDLDGLVDWHEKGRLILRQLAIFPSSRSEADLEGYARAMQDGDLERTAFTVAMQPDDSIKGRLKYSFRVPGKVLEVLEHLALGREFGGNLGRVEMALLQGLNLRPKQSARLLLAMHDGEAALMGADRGGRRRIRYLESGKGYTGTYEEMSLSEAVSERLQTSWERFPVGVVMFAGLPFFIGGFWLKNRLERKRRAESSGEPADP